jgi:hypothetical protein
MELLTLMAALAEVWMGGQKIYSCIFLYTEKCYFLRCIYDEFLVGVVISSCAEMAELTRCVVDTDKITVYDIPVSSL